MKFKNTNLTKKGLCYKITEAMLLCMWKYGSQLLHIYGILQKIEKKNPKTNPWFLSKCPPRNDKKKREKIFNVCASVFFFCMIVEKIWRNSPTPKNGFKKLIVKQNELFEAKFLNIRIFQCHAPFFTLPVYRAYRWNWMNDYMTLPTS